MRSSDGRVAQVAALFQVPGRTGAIRQSPAEPCLKDISLSSDFEIRCFYCIVGSVFEHIAP